MGKVCPKCGNEGEFYTNKASRDGLVTYCKECEKARQKLRWQETLSKDPDVQNRHKQNSERWDSTNPDRKYDLHLRRKYGITLEEYNAILERQGGHCAFCPRTSSTDGKRGRYRLHVDHNHVTGKVRGLLCYACNAALNRIETIPEWAEKVRVYLENAL